MVSVLVTGGAGYIGSHTTCELLNAGYEVVIVDNLSNSNPESIRRISRITGKEVKFYEQDLIDRVGLETVFQENNIDAVVHFAGLKAVGESQSVPISYYSNNVSGTLVLCDLMKKYNVKKLVFSSSATVYGMPEEMPIKEHFPLGAINPYGRTKQMIEEILQDLYNSDTDWSIMMLRYFNPVGAHSSGLIGEDPQGVPNNLMPYITQVAAGRLQQIRIFGNDYDTPDGTGVRDYIHVVDLALGHLKALEKALRDPGIDAFNLGTGKGYSVLDLIQTFEKVTGVPIPYVFVDRRPGDADVSYADITKSKQVLGWKAEKGIEDMCYDAWNWQSNNVNGYSQKELTLAELV